MQNGTERSAPAAASLRESLRTARGKTSGKSAAATRNRRKRKPGAAAAAPTVSTRASCPIFIVQKLDPQMAHIDSSHTVARRSGIIARWSVTNRVERRASREYNGRMVERIAAVLRQKKTIQTLLPDLTAEVVRIVPADWLRYDLEDQGKLWSRSIKPGTDPVRPGLG